MHLICGGGGGGVFFHRSCALWLLVILLPQCWVASQYEGEQGMFYSNNEQGMFYRDDDQSWSGGAFQGGAFRDDRERYWRESNPDPYPDPNPSQLQQPDQVVSQQQIPNQPPQQIPQQVQNPNQFPQQVQNQNPNQPQVQNQNQNQQQVQSQNQNQQQAQNQNQNQQQAQNQNQVVRGFYDQSCPSAESVVRRTMVDSFRRNPLLAAGILRLFFHDCFVRGCDGSVLLDRKPGGPIPEKESDVNNNSITGFRVIDDAKKRLERMCPGVVSCSDILALAARDAVWISGGPRWSVPTGRLDGRVSLATEADNEIPPPDLRIRDLRKAFLAKGLNTHDVVTLSGAHTIGRAHCPAFEDRLYNFSATNAPDPTVNLSLLDSLQKICPRVGNTTFTVSLDRQTQVLFDNSYYVQILASNGLLQTDQQLLFDASTAGLVRAYAADSSMFFRAFAKAMIKLSRVGLKAPGEGEIRKHCRRVNP
ncbi:peroxidase A2 [Selaginella moellendorffii]|uniref:peroxidase A2 n=1 Tax=Selaginella moellendorffii TaxID=88036 RepID=UPI000D1C5619|nr:peroxidase A2 [Selaginella moellendorffii]|eukprot:XP_024515020.1 peroxidase A2 [Selaginella moellendorffii]